MTIPRPVLLALAALVVATPLGHSVELPQPQVGDVVVDPCDGREGCAGDDTPTAARVVAPPSTEFPAAGGLDRVENGGFDVSASTGQLRAWAPYTWPYDAGTGTAAWDPSDSGGDPNSGSLVITNNTTNQASTYSYYALSQCIRPGDLRTIPSTCFDGTLRVNVPAGQVPGTYSSEAAVLLGQHFYASTDCSGPYSGGSAGSYQILPQGSGGWTASLSVGGGCANPSERSMRYVVAVRKRQNVTSPVTAYVDMIVSSGSYEFVKGDINRDGETDLLFHNDVTGQNAAWYMKDEARRATPATLTPTPASLDWKIAGTDDFNTDGQNDLVLWNLATGASEFWLMNGTSRVGSPVAMAAAPALPWKPSATADFNKDGKPDIIWRNYSTQKLAVWTMNGTTQLGTLTPNPDQAGDGNWEIVGAPDLTGDGNTDLLWYNWSSGKIVYWKMIYSTDSFYCSGWGLSTPCYNRDSGSFTNPASAGNANWKVLATGDYGIGPSLNGSAQPNTTDLIWRNATSGRMVVWFMDEAGNRTGGVFITPDPPAPATDWTVAGPR